MTSLTDQELDHGQDLIAPKGPIQRRVACLAPIDRLTIWNLFAHSPMLLVTALSAYFSLPTLTIISAASYFLAVQVSVTMDHEQHTSKIQ